MVLVHLLLLYLTESIDELIEYGNAANALHIMIMIMIMIIIIIIIIIDWPTDKRNVELRGTIGDDQ